MPGDDDPFTWDFNLRQHHDQDDDNPETWLFTSSPPLPTRAPHSRPRGVNPPIYSRQRTPPQTDDQSWLDNFVNEGNLDGDRNHTSDFTDDLAIQALLDGDNTENTLDDNSMPSRRHPQSVVDLTQSTSPVRPREPSPVVSNSTGRTYKRTVNSDPSESHRSKRRRENPESSTSRRDRIEDVDLSEENENPSAEEELLQAEQERAIAQQQSNEPRQQRIGQRQCIICMENYTNVTVTGCGHIYCHECLIQSLKMGDRPGGNGGSCPVCRKRVFRNRVNNVIPIAFMTKREYKRQAAARLPEA